MGQGVWDALSGNIRWVISNYDRFSACYASTDVEIRELAKHTIGALEEISLVVGAVQGARALVKARQAATAAARGAKSGSLVIEAGGSFSASER